MTEPTKWTIEGEGTQPSLTFRIERDAKLKSEDNVKGEPPRWTDDNPQPKYQYIMDVTWATWAELFEQAIVSTGWVVGNLCRDGEFTPNAHKDEDGNIVLNEGAEVIKLNLPLPKRARKPAKPMSPMEMIAELAKRAAAGTLTDEERDQLSELGISL